MTFVLNVALSESGQHFVEGDYHHIKRLNAETPFDYLPQVYGWERIAGKTGLNFGMFLGEWFDGYHEFHLTADSSDNTLKIIVWDEILGRYFLTPAQIQTLYAKAAKILTCYYNPVSFEQILAWHHAAGDFIVNIDDSGLRLRLVSVRRYAAIFENQQTAPEDAGDPQILLQALLVFFLNLSIQMRLDRLEGVGEMVWSDNSAVEATLTGFLEALAIKPDPDTLPDSLLACFVAYLAACKSSDLFELSAALISRFNPGMPELPVAQRNLGEHVDTLYGVIQDILAAFK